MLSHNLTSLSKRGCAVRKPLTLRFGTLNAEHAILEDLKESKFWQIDQTSSSIITTRGPAKTSWRGYSRFSKDRDSGTTSVLRWSCRFRRAKRRTSSSTPT